MNEIERKEYNKYYYQKRKNIIIEFNEISDNQLNSMRNEFIDINPDFKYPIYLEALKFVEEGYSYDFSLKVVLDKLKTDEVFKTNTLNTFYTTYCIKYYNKHRSIYKKGVLNNENTRNAYYL